MTSSRFEFSYKYDAEENPPTPVLNEYYVKEINGDASWSEVIMECVRFLQNMYYISPKDERRIHSVLDEIMEDKMTGQDL